MESRLNRTRKRLVFRLTAAVVLILACVAVIVWQFYTSTEPDVGALPAERVERSSQPPPLRANNAPRAPERHEDGVDEGAPSVNESAERVVKMDVRLVRHSQGKRVAASGIALSLSYPDGKVVSDESGAEGLVSLRGVAGTTVELSIQSDAWRFHDWQIKRYSAKEGVAITSTPRPDPKELRVVPVRRYRIACEYEDGAPYRGTAILSRDGSFTSQVLLDGKAESMYLPVYANGGTSRSKWTATFRTRRPGFSSVLEFELGYWSESRLAILPRSNEERGFIEIDFVGPGTQDAIPLLVLVRPYAEDPRDPQSRSGTSRTVGEWPSDTRHTTGTLVPGRYAVRAWSEQGVDEDARLAGERIVDVRANQVTEVRLDLNEPGSTTVEIVDENGDAIPKARLAPAKEIYAGWEHLTRKPAGFSRTRAYAYALTDDEGRAELSMLPPGTHDFICDAKGFNQVIVTAYIESGRTFDCGRVQLKPATGRIVVLVDHDEVDSSSEYAVRLVIPGGGTVTPKTKFSGKRFVFERQPLLPFVVSIEYCKGGYAANSKHAVLSQSSPECVVEFTMRKWPYEDE